MDDTSRRLTSTLAATAAACCFLSVAGACTVLAGLSLALQDLLTAFLLCGAAACAGLAFHTLLEMFYGGY